MTAKDKNDLRSLYSLTLTAISLSTVKGSGPSPESEARNHHGRWKRHDQPLRDISGDSGLSVQRELPAFAFRFNSDVFPRNLDGSAFRHSLDTVNDDII